MAPDIIERLKLESVSIASALSSALTIYTCQIRVHQRGSLNSNFLQLGRRSGGRPQRTVHPRRLPVNIVIHTTLKGLEPTTFRLLVGRATSSATDSPLPNGCVTLSNNRGVSKTSHFLALNVRGMELPYGENFIILPLTYFKMKFLKNNLLLIFVDVSASTGAFVGTVCLIAVRSSVSGRTGCRRRRSSTIINKRLFLKKFILN